MKKPRKQSAPKSASLLPKNHYPTFTPSMNNILQLCFNVQKPPKQIVSLGCGLAEEAYALQNRNDKGSVQYIGIDLDEKKINAAKEYITDENIKLCVGDASDVEKIKGILKNNKADIILVRHPCFEKNEQGQEPFSIILRDIIPAVAKENATVITTHYSEREVSQAKNALDADCCKPRYFENEYSVTIQAPLKTYESDKFLWFIENYSPSKVLKTRTEAQVKNEHYKKFTATCCKIGFFAASTAIVAAGIYLGLSSDSDPAPNFKI